MVLASLQSWGHFCWVRNSGFVIVLHLPFLNFKNVPLLSWSLWIFGPITPKAPFLPRASLCRISQSFMMIHLGHEFWVYTRIHSNSWIYRFMHLAKVGRTFHFYIIYPFVYLFSSPPFSPGTLRTQILTFSLPAHRFLNWLLVLDLFLSAFHNESFSFICLRESSF